MTALHLTQRKKRGRNTGNIYTLSVLLRQLGWSCVILSTELKERKHQLCGDALRWQAGLEGRQRKAFSRSPLPFFCTAAHFCHKVSAWRSRDLGQLGRSSVRTAANGGLCRRQSAVAAPAHPIVLERFHGPHIRLCHSNRTVRNTSFP